MLIEISANYIIDEMIALSQEYESYRKQHKKKYPNGAYIFESTPIGEIRDYIQQEKTEKAMNIIIDIFKDVDMHSVVRVARKWYEKTNWQFCLSDEDGEKLIRLYNKKQRCLSI